jgi:hypothetical protein
MENKKQDEIVGKLQNLLLQATTVKDNVPLGTEA